MNDPRMEEIRGRIAYFEGRKQRAMSRLSDQPLGAWRFALTGMAVDPPLNTSIGLGRLVPVDEPPGEVELARALRRSEEFSSIGRYMNAVTYELELASEIDDLKFALEIAWTILAGLRLKADCEFTIPAVANHSWSTIAGASDGAVIAQLLEDNPQRFKKCRCC